LRFILFGNKDRVGTDAGRAAAPHNATGVQPPPDAIGRFPRKLGFTYEKRHPSPPNVAAPK